MWVQTRAEQELIVRSPTEESESPSKLREPSDFKSRLLRDFWFWDSFYSYAKFLAAFVLSMIIITACLKQNHTFKVTIAFLSSSIEALLGVPQFLLNLRRQNTSGLS